MTDNPADISAPPSNGPSRRARVLVGLVFGALIVILLSLRSIAGFYTDYLWFDSLDFASVWRRLLVAKVGLSLVAMGIMFALVWINLLIADRIAPAFRPPGLEEEFVRRYHETVGHRSGLMRAGIAGLFALLLGAGAGARWQDWILFRNRQDFGINDPQFDKDIGFYVFQLPFVRFAITWGFTALVVVLIVTSAAHYLNGGIRLNAPVERVTSSVKVHMSVLLAMLALIKAVDYWYQRYTLNFSTRGIIDGAGAADIDAQLPAIYLLMLISLAAALLLILNIRRRGWVLPVVAVGLWAFVAVVMGGIYPALYQRIRVEPNESAREEQYIDRNIEATRHAYGLQVAAEGGAGLVDRRTFAANVDDALTEELVAANLDTLQNLRILDPAVLSPTFNALEIPRGQFRFGDDLDVDRYEIDGAEQTVVLAVRELNLDGATGWENQHVTFTHGYGVSMAPANSITGQGEPNFVVGGLPAEVATDRIDLSLDQPRVYIGEGLSSYAIVGTTRCEVDFPVSSTGAAASNPDDDCRDRTDGENQLYDYDGDDGVEAGGFFRRVAFALRFQDLNPIFSGLIDDDSRFIYHRDVRDRAAELAPFLEFDADSYPIVVDGRIKFVIDAYTTSSSYPYSQRADANGLTGGSDLGGTFNYVRNSVKVVVDAYDGDVTFYVVDEADPIIQAYMQAFPGLFTVAFPESGEGGMPLEVAEHLRYPEDLFSVQTNMWGRYHLNRADAFFEAAGAWEVAADPGTDLTPDTPTPAQATATTATAANSDPISPFYVQMQLPGETEQEFVLIRPYEPANSDRLAAFVTGRISDKGELSLVSYTMAEQNVKGPFSANVSMLQDGEVAETTTLLGRGGSTVRLGNMLLVPIEGTNNDDALLYLRPLYVEAANSQPAVQQIIAAYGDRVRICGTVELVIGALLVPDGEVGEGCSGVQPVDLGRSSVVPDDIATPDNDNDAPNGGDTADPETDSGSSSDATDALGLLQEADDAFVAAAEALSAGELGRYQELVDEAEARVSEALALIESQSTSGSADDAAPEEEADDPPAAEDPEPSPTPEGA